MLSRKNEFKSKPILLNANQNMHDITFPQKSKENPDENPKKGTKPIK